MTNAWPHWGAYRGEIKELRTASITGGNTAERSDAVFPVRVHAHVGRSLFCYFINSRLKAMMTMPPMRPKTLSCPLP
jgi:hypothetical protein